LLKLYTPKNQNGEVEILNLIFININIPDILSAAGSWKQGHTAIAVMPRLQLSIRIGQQLECRDLCEEGMEKKLRITLY
jgi:hypothetical protein